VNNQIKQNEKINLFFSEKVLITILLSLGVVIRIYGIDFRCLYGDEYSSIDEAYNVSFVYHSLSYFLLFHEWIKFGESEFWLRLFSTVWGSLLIPVLYYLAKELSDKRIAFITSLLGTFSSFAIGYSQQVRYYTFFLFVSSLSFLIFFIYLRQKKSKKILLSLIGINIVLIFSHLFGFLTVAVEIIVYFLLTGNTENFWKRVGIILSILSIPLLILFFIMPVRELLWYSILEYVHSQSRLEYVNPRGINIVSIAKIPFTFFFFTFGEYVYPFNYIFVLPGVVVYATLFIAGLIQLSKNRTSLIFVITALLLPIIIIYLVADSLTTAVEGASVRFIIFILPVYYIVVAYGIISFKKFFPFTLLIVLIINFISILFLWKGDWSYNEGALINWRKASTIVEKYVDKSTIITYSGRSKKPIQYYFPDNIFKKNYWNYIENDSLSELIKFKKVIFISNEWRNENREELNRFIKLLQNSYICIDAYIKYPMFMYIFELKSKDKQAFVLNNQIEIPKEIYGLQFKDLKLPLQILYNEQSITINGIFTLPGINKEKEILIKNLNNDYFDKFVIFSNLTECNELKDGGKVAEIIISNDEQQEEVFILKKGIEVEDWGKNINLISNNKKYKIVYRWEKKFIFLGQMKYQRSWNEFDANIYATELIFDKKFNATSIKIRYLASNGQINIFGISMLN
jgi:hypothetical protein